MQSALGSDDRAIATREWFAKEVFCETRQFLPSSGVKAGGRADASDLALRDAQSGLKLPQEEGNFDRLSACVCVYLVQDQPADVGVLEQHPVSRQQEDMLEHGVVCHKDVRRPLKHFTAREKPVFRSMPGIWKIGLKRRRGGNPRFLLGARRI